MPAGQFSTLLAEPPWQFTNKTGKIESELDGYFAPKA